MVWGEEMGRKAWEHPELLIWQRRNALLPQIQKTDETLPITNLFLLLQLLQKIFPGGTLLLDWRFTTSSPKMTDAVALASAAWRRAVLCFGSALDPVCVDFRVLQVKEKA